MSDLLAKVQQLIGDGRLRVSAHGFEELESDGISLSELLDASPNGKWVEEYQDYHKGPCVLVLVYLADGSAVHALWGIAKSSPDEVTLITAYRPDPKRWTSDFRRRKPK